VRLGGHLVTINDANENQQVYILARDNNAGLIGLYDPSGENKWVWASNQESSYSNWSPEKRPYIGIEKWANISYLDSEQPYTGYWNTHQSGPGMYNSAGIAEIPFIRRGNSAYVSVQGPSWLEAEANAVKLGGHLTSIDSADENAWIVSTFDPLVTGNAFIGYSDSKTEGQWIWSDGSPATYTNWHPGEPNNAGEEDFAAIGLTVGDGKWNDWGGSGLVGIAEIPLLPNNLPTGVPLIHGSSAPGQVIAIDGAGLQDQDNFSGYTPEYQYSWEVSTDGSTWSPLTSADATDKNNTYVILSSDVGSKIRGVVSYVDGYGTQELIASSSVDVEVLKISLSLMLGSVSEDGTTNLLFTFTRSGPVSSALSVNYTVGGTATLDTDYTGIAATPSTKTVTFAAGSGTTTVTVNPTIDTLREFDESETLTLAASSSYTIGATSTATGIIIDDDRSFRLSTLSGLSLLRDDGSGVIRLQRANASSVPVTWGNNTPLTAASFPGWQLLAAAQVDGADSLLWRYTPTGQLHAWTLDQNGRQISGSPLFAPSGPAVDRLERQFHRDLNSDGQVGPKSSVVSELGSTILSRSASTDRLSVLTVDPLAASSALVLPASLFWGGSPILAVDSRLPGWSAVAASSIDGVNTLLWRNQSTDLLATWSFDALWNAVSGTAPVLAKSDGGFALEKVFKTDLNNDGVVGAPFVVLATDGVTSLVRMTSDRRLAVQSSNGQVQPLIWGSAAITESDRRLPGWSAISAVVVNGINTIVWRNSATSLLATWSFDSQWRATGGTTLVAFSSPQSWDYELWSKKDLNNDHVIGVPPSGVVSTVGDLWLQRLGPALNLYAFKPGSPTFSLLWGGSQLSTTDPRLSGWSPLAAATIDGVNSLLWRYDATGQLTTWSFDANWNAISGTPPVEPVSRAAYDLETAFRSDANRDGVIGSPHQVTSSIGSIDLLTDSDGLLLISRNGLPPISMAWGGAALTVNDPRLTGWTAIAATDRSGSNSLLWRHINGLLATWTLDANWNAVSGTAPVPSDSQAALVIEEGFSRDLNGDGVIGEPTSPIERLRYRLQQVAPSSNSRDPFSSVFSGGPTADVIVAATFNDLLTGSDLITGLPLQAGAIDLLDGGTESSRTNIFWPSPARRSFLLSSITNQPFADDGDAGYVLIRNYDPLNDDLVLASDLPLTTAVRSVAFDGITVSGIGLHIDKNRNGFYDPGDNLIGLLDGITTVPSRLIRLPAG